MKIKLNHIPVKKINNISPPGLAGLDFLEKKKLIFDMRKEDPKIIYDTMRPVGDEFWNLIDEDSPYYDENYLTKSNWNLVKVMKDDMVGISLKKRQGIFTGYLGHSEKHNESVGTLMWNRLHISAFFGLTSFI